MMVVDVLKIRFEYISSKENIPYNRGGNWWISRFWISFVCRALEICILKQLDLDKGWFFSKFHIPSFQDHFSFFRCVGNFDTTSFNKSQDSRPVIIWLKPWNSQIVPSNMYGIVRWASKLNFSSRQPVKYWLRLLKKLPGSKD